MNKIARVWAAGVIDAGGTLAVRIQGHGCRVPTLRVHAKRSTVLVKLREILGAGSVTGYEYRELALGGSRSVPEALVKVLPFLRTLRDDAQAIVEEFGRRHPPECNRPDCHRDAVARHLCRRHYQEVRRQVDRLAAAAQNLTVIGDLMTATKSPPHRLVTMATGAGTSYVLENLLAANPGLANSRIMIVVDRVKMLAACDDERGIRAELMQLPADELRAVADALARAA
jgi:hypothetical protein